MDESLQKSANENNLVARIEELEKTVRNLAGGTQQLQSLDQITDDLGDVRAGRFLAMSSGNEPTDADATCVFMSAEGETFGSDVYNIGGVFEGGLQFGFNSTTGKAAFAGGNAIIDIDGISATDLLKWLVKQTATNDTYTRTLKLGLALQEGRTVPIGVLSYESPVGTELVANGGAEDGDFTGWTKTSGGVNWTVSSVYQRTGNYCFKIQDPGILTSDRIVITGDTNYLCSGYCKNNTGYAKIEVNWYDDAAAGLLLRTDLIIQNNANIFYMGTDSALLSPTDALSCEIVLTSTAAGGNSYFDDISVGIVTVSQKLQLTDNGIMANDVNGIVTCHQLIHDPTLAPVATITGTAGVVTTGVHLYAYSWVDDIGETKISPYYSLDVINANRQILVASVGIGSGTVNSRNIYRTKSGETTPYYLLGSIANNTDTTFTDNVADADLTVEAPLVNTTATYPLLPTRAAWFWDEAITAVTRTAYLSSSQQYFTFWYNTAGNANDGDVYTLSGVLAAGTYTLTVLGSTGNYYGKLDWYIDGVLVGSGQDWYSAAATYNVIKTITDISVETNGYHVFRAVVNGKTGTDYSVAITKVWINQAAD